MGVNPLHRPIARAERDSRREVRARKQPYHHVGCVQHGADRDDRDSDEPDRDL